MGRDGRQHAQHSGQAQGPAAAALRGRHPTGRRRGTCSRAAADVGTTPDGLSRSTAKAPRALVAAVTRLATGGPLSSFRRDCRGRGAIGATRSARSGGALRRTAAERRRAAAGQHQEAVAAPAPGTPAVHDRDAVTSCVANTCTAATRSDRRGNDAEVRTVGDATSPSRPDCPSTRQERLVMSGRRRGVRAQFLGDDRSAGPVGPRASSTSSSARAPRGCAISYAPRRRTPARGGAGTRQHHVRSPGGPPLPVGRRRRSPTGLCSISAAPA